MKPYSIFRRLAAVPTLAFIALGSLSQAAMVLYYNFNDDTGVAGSAALNSAPGATVNGIYTAGSSGGTTALVTSQAGVYGANTGMLGGNALRLIPNADGNGDFTAPHINTGAAASAWGFSKPMNSDYTAMAWVKFNNQNGDNMVFGQGTGNRVHLGSRGDEYWSGHWGDDINSGGAFGPELNTDIANWHHVAWTNANDGTQEIFVDGVSVASGGSPSLGQFIPGNDLLIGTSGNGGSFNGLLDEVKIFDTLLTPAEIVAASSVVPEPSGCVLVGLIGAAGLLLRHRD